MDSSLNTGCGYKVRPAQLGGLFEYQVLDIKSSRCV